jgi:hypothetical protein
LRGPPRDRGNAQNDKGEQTGQRQINGARRGNVRSALANATRICTELQPPLLPRDAGRARRCTRWARFAQRMVSIWLMLLSAVNFRSRLTPLDKTIFSKMFEMNAGRCEMRLAKRKPKREPPTRPIATPAPVAASREPSGRSGGLIGGIAECAWCAGRQGRAGRSNIARTKIPRRSACNDCTPLPAKGARP